MAQPPARVGRLLRGYRLSAGLSQRELAGRAGVSLRALRDIELDRVHRPRAQSVGRLMSALDLRDADRRALLATVGATAPAAGPGRLWLTVLGPLGLHHDEVAVHIGAPMLRSLLAILAIQPGRPVRRDEIVDTLWGDRPPRSCLRLVRVYIAALRTALGPAAGLLATVPGGYALNLDERGSDVLRFDGLTAAARRAPDPRTAFAHYAQALRCWQGPVLADLPARLRDHPRAVAVAGSRVAAALAYGDLAVKLGHYEPAVAELRAVTAAEPLHEGLHARLMLALAGSGQQAAALDVFAGMRDRLAGELGVEPGADLDAAYVRVLRQDLAGDPANFPWPSAPTGAAPRP